MGFNSAAFRRDMRQTRNEITASLATAADRACHLLADEIRRNAPEETGALKASVIVHPAKVSARSISQEVEVTGGHPTAMVGAVEYGTRYEAPNPFFRRSVSAKLAEMIRIIEDAVQGD